MEKGDGDDDDDFELFGSDDEVRHKLTSLIMNV